MLRKRTWVVGILSAVLLTFTMGQSGTTFSCTGGGTGTCVGDVCD